MVYIGWGMMSREDFQLAKSTVMGVAGHTADGEHGLTDRGVARVAVLA